MRHSLVEPESRGGGAPAGPSDGPKLPPSFLARLEDRLASCDQPLIQLWSWPWSGKRRLLEALQARQPAAWGKLPPQVALVDRRLSVGKRWLVAEGRYRSAELLTAAEKLRPEQRLVLPVERRLNDEILPQRILGPQEMLLRPAEIEEMFAGAGGAQIGGLAQLSDGWAGPLLWLRDRWRLGDSPEIALGGPRFATRFHQRVTGRLDPAVFDAMIECSIADELDPALWRRVWISRPEKLAALERLVSEWGWVIETPGAPPCLPRLIRRATRSRRPSPERQREIHRQLGLAAHGLGLEAEAERYLSLADDRARLGRLRALGAMTAGPPATAAEAPTAATPAVSAATGPFPRFRLHLLGQAMIRRIDSGGDESELVWRLRRAFQSVAYLALAPDRRATKEQLVDALWRDASPEAIAKNFHPTLSEARRTLGHRQAFVYSQGLYTLNPELDWWIDCERFGELIEQGRRLSTGSPGGQAEPGSEGGPTEHGSEGGQAKHWVSELKEALDAWVGAWRLYRGELLSGLEAGWIRDRRAVLYRDYIELLRGIGDLCVRLGRLTEALDAYRSLLLEEPYEEQVHLAVMELYARQGRRDLVRRQFVRMQELLIQELNVEPVEETRARYHQLMR